MPSDRRTFLRRAAALGLLAPVAAATACRRSHGERGDEGPDTVPQEARLVTDPTVVQGLGDTVHILAPAAEPPVAYLSRGDMRVYLDPAYRDWAEHRLAAYVSVTTGLWRIPRPEDDPRVPITPGDELREFEVVDLALLDPGMTPVEGDVRLRLGAPVPYRIEMSCVPLPGGHAWISSGPMAVRRRDGPVDGGGREDFVGVGTGTRHGDAACTARGEVVRILTWACPPEGG